MPCHNIDSLLHPSGWLYQYEKADVCIVRVYTFKDYKLDRSIKCRVPGPRLACTVLGGVYASYDSFLAGVQQSSLVNPYLSDTQRMERISSYWKFTILRNPLERLVSAFRHRLEAPLDFNGAYNKTFEMIKRSILEDSKPQEFSHWMKSNGSSKLTVDFQTYIRWIVKMPNEKLNEHFIPMIHMSQPCRLRYNFYGNFKQISAEIKLVMQKFDVPSSYFHDKSYYASGHGTATLLQKYYSQLDPKVKLALLKDFSTELDFYYHLFPEDRHTHIDLLGGTK